MWKTWGATHGRNGWVGKDLVDVHGEVGIGEQSREWEMEGVADEQGDAPRRRRIDECVRCGTGIPADDYAEVGVQRAVRIRWRSERHSIVPRHATAAHECVDRRVEGLRPPFDELDGGIWERSECPEP